MVTPLGVSEKFRVLRTREIFAFTESEKIKRKLISVRYVRVEFHCLICIGCN